MEVVYALPLPKNILLKATLVSRSYLDIYVKL